MARATLQPAYRGISGNDNRSFVGSSAGEMDGDGYWMICMHGWMYGLWCYLEVQ